MKKFNYVLVRHGLHGADYENFLVGKETIYGQILNRMMGHLSKPLNEEAIENALMLAFEETEGPGRETLVDPTRQELPLSMLDPYIRGIARWLNELGIHTFCSCDGHNTRFAEIYLKSYLKPSHKQIIEAATPSSINLHIIGKKIHFRYEKGNVKELLKMAENLYGIWANPAKLHDLKAEKFKSRLIELLNIPGESRNERDITNRLKQNLRNLADYQYIDKKGNLLGYVQCGDGPVILLSAHMDTYERIESDREIIEEATILRSSKGILGADDRAGIAIILEVLSRVHQTNFNGTIKFAFTVEEEIGLLGATAIDPEFMEDVDRAIVVDRRGTRDIVTSSWGIIPFCNEEYGQLFEKAAQLAGMPDWKVTEGGSSDARVFAEMGIQSVNLSAGYGDEHTDGEFVDYRASYDTFRLVESVLNLI
jgi:tripeptide aminopeptidase